MAMEMSLKDYKGQLSRSLISILWKQWEKLGIAVWTYDNIPWKWLIDLEALVFATAIMKEEEQRMFHVIQEWLGKHQRLFHSARFKRIKKLYVALTKQMKINVPANEDILNKPSRMGKTRAAEILRKPLWDEPTLLWLKLRALLGAGVRSDVLAYFLYHPLGTSFEISREMFLDQKSVHDVIRIWESAGWVRRYGQRRGYTIIPNFRDQVISLSGITEVPPRFNAGRVFVGILLVKGAIQRFEAHQDEYILSSHLRDIYPLLQELWEQTGTPIPNPVLYPGKAYTPVFLDAVLKACKNLESPRENKFKSSGSTTRPFEMRGIKKFTYQDMYDFAYRTLRRRYPAAEGWKIIPQFEISGYRPDFVVERKDFDGTIRRVIAEVKAECKITMTHIDQLNAFERSLTEKNVIVDKKILIVPAGADTSIVPKDITVIYLRRFKCPSMKERIKPAKSTN